MELGDWNRFDGALAAALTAWRKRTGELAAIDGPLDLERDFAARELSRSPVPESLIHEEVRHELRERASDPVARALSDWIETFWLEDTLFDARFELACAWGLPREVRGRSVPTSVRALRREVVGGRHASVRARAADEFGEWAHTIADPAQIALDRRLDRERALPLSCRSLAVSELAEGVALQPTHSVTLAERWLVATDGLATSLNRPDWQETLALVLASGAQEGWPVRPSSRWIRSVFAREDWTRGLQLGPIKVPTAIGATSYARALGSFGMRVFEACRPHSLPLAVHQPPLSLRKHERRALFASIVAEESFARRVLGLSKEKARDHRRILAMAFLTSSRIDAWRVVVAASARESFSVARERQRELSERVLGAGLSPACFAVFPMLRPGDGAAFCGMLAAVDARRTLVDRHDEDWYRNPRALTELRDEAGLAPATGCLELPILERAASGLCAEFEDALG